MTTTKLGERILAARLEAGLTQSGLSQVSGVGQGHLSEIERGLKTPSLATLKRLRDALGLKDAVWTNWIDAA